MCPTHSRYAVHQTKRRLNLTTMSSGDLQGLQAVGMWAFFVCPAKLAGPVAAGSVRDYSHIEQVELKNCQTDNLQEFVFNPAIKKCVNLCWVVLTRFISTHYVFQLPMTCVLVLGSATVENTYHAGQKCIFGGCQL